MNETEGTFVCPYCGLDTPHGHQPAEVSNERILRPAFENWISGKFRTNISFWLRAKCFIDRGYCWTESPTQSGQFYPYLFGWNGLPKQKRLDGDDYYDQHHWAWRPYFGADYKNEFTQFMWSMFCDIYAAQPVTAEGWISVEDRLPEPGQVVLCFFNPFGGPRGIDSSGRFTGMLVRELIHKDGLPWANEGVTHWMPAPAIPTLTARPKRAEGEE